MYKQIITTMLDLTKRAGVLTLIISHVLVCTPLPEAGAMESANYKINESTASSASGKNESSGAVLSYTNAGEPAIGNASSANYKVSLGYINTIASNPPVFRPLIPDTNMRIVWDKGVEGTTLDLKNFFSSPDGSHLTYSVLNDVNELATVSADTGIVTFAEKGDYYGSEVVKFTATDDSKNMTYSNNVILVVKNASGNAPIIYPIDKQVVSEGQELFITPTVYDPDGQTLSVEYSAPLDKDGKWTPGYNDAGTYNATITCSDGTLKTSTTVVIEVKNTNRAPIIDDIAPITKNEGELVMLAPKAYDPDGDAVTVSYSGEFTGEGTWQTGYKDSGVYDIVVTASDGELKTEKHCTVTITDAASKPIIKMTVSKYNMAMNEAFTLYIIAADPAGFPLKLTLKKNGNVIDGCENIALQGNTYTKTFSYSEPGGYVLDAVATQVRSDGVTPLSQTASQRVSVFEDTTGLEEPFPINGDFNGDGLTDLGYFMRGTGDWKVMLSDHGQFKAYEYWLVPSEDFDSGDGYCYPLMNDFNADGKLDAGLIRVPTSETGKTSYIRMALSDGKDFIVKDEKFRDSLANQMINDWHYTTFCGDFNGDGISDIGQVPLQDNSNPTVEVGLTRDNLGVEDLTAWGSAIAREFFPVAGDFNGDGLSDICFYIKGDGRWSVALSKGNCFDTTTDWATSFGADKDPVFGDFNYDGFTDIGYIYKENGQWWIKFAYSDGTKFVTCETPYATHIPDYMTGSFVTGDFNGDGLFDVAVFNKTSKEWYVSLNKGKYPDLLNSIDNGIGGKTSITYKNSVEFDNTDANGLPIMPFSVRVVSEVTQDDGLGHSYTASHFYKHGYFDTAKREFRGFGYVRVSDAEGSQKETYFNQDDTFKGRPAKEVVKDKLGNVYAETLYNWKTKKVYSDKGEFPYLEDKTSRIYDPDTGETKSSKTSYTYDDYGNSTYVREEGFLDVTGDEKEAAVEYYYDTARWILSKPLLSTVKGADGKIVSASKYYYDGLGSLLKEEKWLGLPGETPAFGVGTNPTAEFTYDSVGNVETVKDAYGRETRTAYDTQKTFPLSVTNCLQQQQTFTYDKKTGKILTSTDPNVQTTVSEYDSFGRLEKVTGPLNISIVEYTYDLVSRPTMISTRTKVNDSDWVSAWSFVDGLGRQILSRVQAEEGGVAKHLVSGEVLYDSRGQVVRKYLPYFINVPTPANKYLPPQNSTMYIRYVYDSMGRLVQTIRPDNKVSRVIYGVDWMIGINENGQTTKQIKDSSGRITKVIEDLRYVTDYVYDTLGNLTDTYDSATPRNHVQMSYDTLGRKIGMTDPDMGGFAGKSWTYVYDKVGNLVSQTDAKGQTITFVYDDINRLVSKSTGVTYIYDDETKENCIGRLSKVEDNSGNTEFFYDILGREIKSTKTVTTGSFTMERTYDSLDRLITVKYPDDTVLTYYYNVQGGISKISGPGNVNYVASVDYNANGQIMKITYGNGTSTDYKYDPYTFRLDSLKTANNSSGSIIQALSYTFDPIGNVASIFDTVNTNTQFFKYDRLNRLVEANGAAYGLLTYQHDSIGNLLKNGDITMQYGQGAGPHAATSYRMASQPSLRGGSEGTDEAISISYDHNGNMTKKGISTFEYDIENRLEKVRTEKGGGVATVNIDLVQGWNFFSLPVNVPASGNNIKAVLSSIDGKYEQVSKYDTAEGKWKHFVGNAKFDQFSTFEYGEGYLIYAKENCSVSVTGNFPLERQTKALKAGWNLISAPTETEIDVSEALSGVTYDAIAGYDGTAYAYNITKLLKGKSYWVHVASDVAWSIPLPKVETTYLYDGDGGRVQRVSSRDTASSLRANEVSEAISNVYIGAAYEMEGVPGENADKIIKHVFMGETRVCSIETTTTAIGASTSSLRGTASGASGDEAISHTYYYHQDHLGSSNVITNETGAVVDNIEYTPFGTIASKSGGYSTDKLYTGKTYDDSANLYYYGARYYDPQLGRFITSDPTIQHPYDPQDFNRYAYARNNPIRYTDPTGLSFLDDLWDAIAGFFGAVVGVIVTVITGNPILGGAVGGAVAGAISGAVHGGFEGALKGAAIGFCMGAAMGAGEALMPGFSIIAAFAGFAYAGSQGPEAVGSFVAGAVGSFYGSALGNVIAPTNRSNGMKNTAVSQKTNKSNEALASDYIKKGLFQKLADLGRSDLLPTYAKHGLAGQGESIMLAGEIENMGDAVGNVFDVVNECYEYTREANFWNDIQNVKFQRSLQLDVGTSAMVDVYVDYTGHVIYSQWQGDTTPSLLNADHIKVYKVPILIEGINPDKNVYISERAVA